MIRARAGASPSSSPTPEPGGSGIGPLATGGLVALVGASHPASLLADGLASLTRRGPERLGAAVSTLGHGVEVRRGASSLAELRAWAGSHPALRWGAAYAGPSSAAGRPQVGRAAGAQPASGAIAGSPVVAVLCGGLFDAAELWDTVSGRGALARDGGQAELLLHLLAQSRQRTLVNRLVDGLGQVTGAFAGVVGGEQLLVATRDPRGYRPLWLGELGAAHMVASEQGAIRAMGGAATREVAPGEMVILEEGSPAMSLRPWPRKDPAVCLPECLRFQAMDGVCGGLGGYEFRQRLGRRLAREAPTEADLVLWLPGECSVVAMGYAAALGTPCGAGLLRRGAGLQAGGLPAGGRLEAVVGAVGGSRVVLVLDPAVLEAEWRMAVMALRQTGARQVHLRLSAPPLVAPCPCGVRHGAPLLQPGRDEQGGDQPDSVVALSQDGLVWALGSRVSDFCAFCVGGRAPPGLRDTAARPQLPLFGDAGTT